MDKVDEIHGYHQLMSSDKNTLKAIFCLTFDKALNSKNVCLIMSFALVKYQCAGFSPIF